MIVDNGMLQKVIVGSQQITRFWRVDANTYADLRRDNESGMFGFHPIRTILGIPVTITGQSCLELVTLLPNGAEYIDDTLSKYTLNGTG